jgi:mRNA interferase MazF
MKKFEIWLADLDPSFGTEAGKIRPVTIVQTNFLNNKHKSTVICPITSKVKPLISIISVHLNAGEGGLNEDSDIMVDQIRAIDNSRFVKKLGDLPPQYHAKLNQNLSDILDL